MVRRGVTKSTERTAAAPDDVSYILKNKRLERCCTACNDTEGYTPHDSQGMGTDGPHIGLQFQRSDFTQALQIPLSPGGRGPA